MMSLNFYVEKQILIFPLGKKKKFYSIFNINKAAILTFVVNILNYIFYYEIPNYYEDYPVTVSL